MGSIPSLGIAPNQADQLIVISLGTRKHPKNFLTPVYRGEISCFCALPTQSLNDLLVLPTSIAMADDKAPSADGIPSSPAGGNSSPTSKETAQRRLLAALRAADIINGRLNK
jgi:hypothetical protein